MRSQIEMDQRIDWLSSQVYKLQQRVEQLERERLVTTVSPTTFATATEETTGETL